MVTALPSIARNLQVINYIWVVLMLDVSLGFGVYEHSCPYPLIPPRLLRGPSFNFLCSFALLWVDHSLLIGSN